MASEAAVLGVPALFISDTGRGYTDEQERKYGLVFNFKRSEQEAVWKTLKSLLERDNLSEEFQRKRRLLLQEKTDTTDWLIDYIDTLF